ncbi:MFS transporter [Flaviaesturariibacter flavus]|uniref:MFS transporter n=1 Tax=Flaviaesturariibacter flavus TaxID=2502780 RepID=A0A4R1BKN0_9BACT|nr:MFS transporter [Flaviaesturariibacter flavus]
MNRKERLLLLLLASINFTHILDFMIMMPLGNYLMPYFRISPQQFTILVAAYTVSAGVSGFIAAFFVDRFDRKRVLIFGYAGFLIGTLACGFAPSYGALLGARLVAGLFGGLIGAQVLSIISDVFPYERRGRAMGAVMSAFSIASTFGVPFSLYLANIVSWHAPFLLVGSLGAVLIPFIAYHVPAMDKHILPARERATRFSALASVWQHPKQRLALLFSGLIMMGHFLIVPFINPFMEFNLGYSKKQTPMIYLAGGICAFFAANYLGKLADKYGKLRVFTVCILLSLPLVLFLTHMPRIPFAGVLGFFGLWFIMSTGRGVAAQALVSNVVPPQSRGSFMSFNSSVQQLGTSAASLLAGVLVLKGEQGQILRYGWLGYASLVILLLCVFIGQYNFRDTHQAGIGAAAPAAKTIAAE